MPNAICTEEDCTKKAISRGLCGGHYSRHRRNAVSSTCKQPSCEKQADGSWGWCNSHYQRWLHHGDPLGGNKAPSQVISYVDGTKECTVCGERLSLENFHKDNGSPSGLRAQCKTCRLHHVKRWYGDNAERQRERQRRQRIDKPERVREIDKQRYQRDRAKRIALATSAAHRRRDRIANSERVDKGINTSTLRKRLGERCHLCKRKMDFTPAVSGQYKPRRASIEHLVPISAGGLHVWENVVLTCLACNLTRPKNGDDGIQLPLIS